MPFTPFHFGVGAAVKAVVPRAFSFSAFCFAQVVTDTEVLVHMARGDNGLHTFFHTYVGAVAVGVCGGSWEAAVPNDPEMVGRTTRCSLEGVFQPFSGNSSSASDYRVFPGQL